MLGEATRRADWALSDSLNILLYICGRFHADFRRTDCEPVYSYNPNLCSFLASDARLASGRSLASWLNHLSIPAPEPLIFHQNVANGLTFLLRRLIRRLQGQPVLAVPHGTGYRHAGHS